MDSVEKNQNAAANLSAIADDPSYEAALDELDRLWDAQADTPDGKYFDALVALVMDYEDRNRGSDLSSGDR